MALLLRRLPPRLQGAIGWLRQPSRRWIRIPAGVLLLAGGVLSILPILGLWMLPLGIVILAEDIAPLRTFTDQVLDWMERRKPHWLGLRPGEKAASPNYVDAGSE